MSKQPTLADLWRAEALREQAIQLCEKLASELTVARVTIHQLSKSSGRNFDRLINAEHRAEIAEAALTSSCSRPTRVAALLLRCWRLLSRLTLCPTCGLRDDHRYNCRVARLVAAIDAELTPGIEAAHDRESQRLVARIDWKARKK